MSILIFPYYFNFHLVLDHSFFDGIHSFLPGPEILFFCRLPGYDGIIQFRIQPQGNLLPVHHDVGVIFLHIFPPAHPGMPGTTIPISSPVQIGRRQSCLMNLVHDFLAFLPSFLLSRGGIFRPTATTGTTVTIQQINDTNSFGFSTDAPNQGRPLPAFASLCIRIQNSPVSELLPLVQFEFDGV